jgi:phosphate starvation-inducible PhoH-like protein
LKTVQALEFTAPRDDNARLANLCGPLDENLRQIEQALDVTLARRGHRIRSAAAARSSRSRRSRTSTTARAIRCRSTTSSSRWSKCVTPPATAGSTRSTCAFAAIPIIRSTNRRRRSTTPRPTRPAPKLYTRRADLRGRTPAQREYLKQILQHDVTFGIGPAGTGKTYLAVACAVDALERDQVKRIVLTRPAVEAGERSASCPATWRRRSTRTCARCTTRCTTCSASTRPRRCSSAR